MTHHTNFPGLLAHNGGRTFSASFTAFHTNPQSRHRASTSLRCLPVLEAFDDDDMSEDAKAHQAAAQQAREIDVAKVTSLYGTINGLPYGAEVRRILGELAFWLDPSEREWIDGISGFHETLASASYLNEQAFRIGAAVEAMVSENQADYSIVSMSSPAWRFSPEELGDVSLEEFTGEIISQFEFLGMGDRRGSLLAFVHGYFDPLNREFELSLFGLADKPMAEAIDCLRVFPSFGDRDQAGELITVLPLTAYLRPLPTLMQTDWPMRIRYADEGKRQFMQFEGLIEGPYLAHSLMWRDRWDLSSATVMIGLYVQDDRLKPYPKVL